MATSEKVLVVINPNRESQPALDRIKQLSQHHGQSDREYVFLALANMEFVEREQNRCTVTRELDWLTKIKSDIETLGVKNRFLVCWSSDWAQTLVDTIDELGITFTIVPFYGKLRSSLLSDERWKLLRRSQSPLVIAVDTDRVARQRILATVKSQDPQYDSRNAAVLETTHRFVDLFGSEIHVVNAYSDSMAFPDRAVLAKAASTDAAKVHIRVGDPVDVICDVASEQEVDLVLIASQRRQGLKGRLRGNTVEKIVGKLNCDIIMI